MNTFLETFLRHHYHRAANGELTNVLKHCHVYGMWSIMLHDEPGNRVRIFFADYNHKLHLNDNFDENMVLGIHPHHCDITLYPLFGTICNVLFWDNANFHSNTSKTFKSLRYNSAILNKTPSLDVIGEHTLHYNKNVLSSKLQGSVVMPAKQLHSIYVPESQIAAWVVMEGKEDPNYQNIMYSNNTHFDFSRYYKKDFSHNEFLEVF